MASALKQRYVLLKGDTPKHFNPIITTNKTRSHRKMDTRIIVEGEAGIGKSYFALRLGEMLDKKFRDDPKKAVEEQVFFSASEYLKAVVTQPPYSVLIYDEAGQTWHHREFMSEANLILSKTMIGYRFKRFITILCIPTIDMIDKDARSLTQFLVNVTKHGQAEVYRTIVQKFGGPSFYAGFVHKLTIPLVGDKLAKAYETKKALVQDTLYETFHKQLSASEAPKLTFSDCIESIKQNPTEYMKGSNLSVPLISAKLGVGYNKANALRAKIDDDKANDAKQ